MSGWDGPSALDQSALDLSALELGAGIAAGRIDPRALAEVFLDRIKAPDAPSNVYLAITRERAMAEAEAAAERAKRGLRRGPLDGVPVSWKDLFDTAGTATTAGSRLLAGRVPERDAALVARGTRAGLVCLGKTSLTEFAFSGLGYNPTMGAPVHPDDPDRIPGGSSSGAAVSVCAGLAAAAIGTDTGGSIRIPAAWTGLVGLKTTAGSLPMAGVLPLARSYDSVGPLTRDVADAAALWAVLADGPAPDLAGARAGQLVLVRPRGAFFGGIEPAAAEAMERAAEALAKAGARIESRDWPVFDDMAELLAREGSPVAAEAYGHWQDTLEARPAEVFPEVLKRFRMGRQVSGPGLARLQAGLTALSARCAAELEGMTALLMPAVAVRPPKSADITAGSDAYQAANGAALKLTAAANFLNLTAIALPAGRTQAGAQAPALPFGVMLVAGPGREAALLRAAAAAEKPLCAGL